MGLTSFPKNNQFLPCIKQKRRLPASEAIAGWKLERCVYLWLQNPFGHCTGSPWFRQFLVLDAWMTASTYSFPCFVTNMEFEWDGIGEIIGQCSDSCLMAWGNRNVGYSPVSEGSYVSPADPAIPNDTNCTLFGSLSRMDRDGRNLEG